jgi:hypothetical protein
MTNYQDALALRKEKVNQVTKIDLLFDREKNLSLITFLNESALIGPSDSKPSPSPSPRNL